MSFESLWQSCLHQQRGDMWWPRSSLLCVNQHYRNFVTTRVQAVKTSLHSYILYMKTMHNSNITRGLLLLILRYSPERALGGAHESKENYLVFDSEALWLRGEGDDECINGAAVNLHSERHAAIR